LNSKKEQMKNSTCLFFLLLFTQTLIGQDLIERTQKNLPSTEMNGTPNRIAQMIDQQRSSGPFVAARIFEFNEAFDKSLYSDKIEDEVHLTLSNSDLQQLRAERPQNLLFKIPVAQDQFIELELTRVRIQAESFQIITFDGKTQPGDDNLFYRGIVNNDSNSFGVLSIFETEIRLLIADQEGTYILGKLGDSQEDYVLYNENKLKVNIDTDWVCETDELLYNKNPEINTKTTNANPGDCVNIYIEADYEIYQDQGSNLTNVVNYVFAIMNEVTAQFALAGVNMRVSTIGVWTEPDPFIDYTTTLDILTNFRADRTSFNGDLAHFITSRSFGGIAYLDVLCGNSPYGMSGGLTSGNPANLPTSSSTFVRIAHELGHNLGLKHTHACVWNGNETQIDDCGNVWADEDNEEPEGVECYNPNSPILPAPGGGTIMSYCHLSLEINGEVPVGRNLLNGFTVQGDQIMQNSVINANCLASTCEGYIAKACSEFNSATAFGPGNTTIVDIQTTFPDLNNANDKIEICVTTIGDVSSTAEVFNVIDESGTLQGQTNYDGEFDCSGTTANFCFEVSAALYNTWKADGVIRVIFDPISDQINPNLCNIANRACATLNILPEANLLTCDDENLTLNNNVASNTYVANNKITSKGQVSNGSTVFFQAGQVIELGTDFHAENGSTFTARIANCISDRAADLSDRIVVTAERPKQKTQLLLQPNPTSLETTAQFYLPASGNAVLELYSGSGILLKRLLDNQIIAEGPHAVNLDMKQYAGGIYFLVLRTSDSITSEKLIVTK